MKVLILGSGLLGVTTAYELGKRGFDVTVLDRNSESGRETSYSNGAQLSYSHAEPWASPAILSKIPKWIFRSDAPLVFRPRADWEMLKWLVKFLRNCTSSRADINCVNLLRLGLYSKEKFDVLRKETGIEFDFNEKGILHIFSTDHDFEHTKKQRDFQRKFGSDHRVLTPDECLALEPALADTTRALVGGIHAYEDQIGDAFTYCTALADVAAQRYGVKFKYGVTIEEMHMEDRVITGVTTSEGDISADGYVMAMGSYSTLFLRDLGINVPIYPMKGYSITLPADQYSPHISITDGSHKIVYARLGDRLRVSGTAELAGHNQSINEKRITPIVNAGKELFPKTNWDQPIEKWACLRPSTPDGPPIMGLTPIRNLFLNTGHGTLGWTQVAGSAAIVADLMEGKTPGIMLHGLTLERYM